MAKDVIISLKNWEMKLDIEVKLNEGMKKYIYEIWEKLGYKTFLLNEKFSDVNNEYLENNVINIPVSINGKKRSVITVSSGLEIDELQNIAMQDPNVLKFITTNIKKVIAVKDKFINFVIEKC